MRIRTTVLAPAALATIAGGPVQAQRGNAGAGGGTGNASGPTGPNTGAGSTDGVPGRGLPGSAARAGADRSAQHRARTPFHDRRPHPR